MSDFWYRIGMIRWLPGRFRRWCLERMSVWGWDKDGNRIGYHHHENTVAFDEPPQSIRWDVTIADDEAVRVE